MISSTAGSAEAARWPLTILWPASTGPKTFRGSRRSRSRATTSSQQYDVIARAAKQWPNHPVVSSRDAERLDRARRPGPSQSSPPTCTRRRLHPLTDWTSTDVARPAPVSMNCEQFAQATDTSPLSLREREPSKSLGSLLLGTSWELDQGVGGLLLVTFRLTDARLRTGPRTKLAQKGLRKFARYSCSREHRLPRCVRSGHPYGARIYPAGRYPNGRTAAALTTDGRTARSPWRCRTEGSLRRQWSRPGKSTCLADAFRIHEPPASTRALRQPSTSPSVSRAGEAAAGRCRPGRRQWSSARSALGRTCCPRA